MERRDVIYLRCKRYDALRWNNSDLFTL